MSKDLQIIPDTDATVEFYVRGASEDIGLMLLQRLYVCLFSDPGTGFRDGDGGYTLWNFLEGGNIPPKEVMDAILATSCASAVNMLDQSDRDSIASFVGEANDSGEVICTLTLADGTTVKGTLTNG